MSKSNVKNAYMIMAHNNWKQLKILIRLLDDENNDFYIHIDRPNHLILNQTIT